MFTGSKDLEAGTTELSAGSRRLAAGASSAADGAVQLDVGIGKIAVGQEQVADGLPAAVVGSGQLADGIGAVVEGQMSVARGLTDVRGQAIEVLRSQFTQGTARTARPAPLIPHPSWVRTELPPSAGVVRKRRRGRTAHQP